ncbi:MAG: glycosyl hydrolase 115 family protein [Prevotella sp.]|nr:glycosyl hydrolase 115 family protein [Prevotella sp.]
MKELTARWLCMLVCMAMGSALMAKTTDTGSAGTTNAFPRIAETAEEGWFPLSEATICTDAKDYEVVRISARMLADDIQRVTGKCPSLTTSAQPPIGPCVVAGTLGNSRLIDQIVKRQGIDVSAIRGKWESFLVVTTQHPRHHTPVLAIIGSDRRGTAFGLTSLSEAIGVSPWYWWADVNPAHKEALYVEPIRFWQQEPSVQYRGIFINDERFGGWARWAEQHFEKETGKVGPKTYQKVFELLLRLKANYLWPAMHPGTQSFNDDPENARLADDYAIVMGSSHCEQMLRNNEGEWKAVGTYGDFNYITNRKTMQDYWEERVRTNGKYENTYTLGLRGIHDYPMEGANSTAERVKLMQQAIDDQRDILRRNILTNKTSASNTRRPSSIEEIPQVLCTYEEVLDAYHNGLHVPEDVTLLWSDDKHGYCRNLCNPEEMKRKGGAGIYYHLSYHGDPASWIWLSPLSPAFLSTELTKAYTYGARKIWVFNVGDIKPAEKEISFVMELAWNIDRWKPTVAHDYTKVWAAKTFGKEWAQEVADLQQGYYQLQAGGKEAHVWFIDYSKEQIEQRIARWRALAAHASDLMQRMPERLKDACFELVGYPIRGAAMANEYQLLARRSMVRATVGDSLGAMADANRVKEMFAQLNAWTDRYNNETSHGKWAHFFNWQPYHWFRSEKIDPPVCTPELLEQAINGPAPRFLSVTDALSADGVTITFSPPSAQLSQKTSPSGAWEASTTSTSGAMETTHIPLWIEAYTPIQNYSKEAKDNVFCHVTTENDSFDASATPINNVWHAHNVGPMWSCVGTLNLKKGNNKLRISDLKPDARIDRIYIGLYPPFAKEPRVRIAASHCQRRQGGIEQIVGLGYTDGMVVLPFNTPSYQAEDLTKAPCIDYELDLQDGDQTVEVRTLPTLRVYEGRDARYAVQLGDGHPEVFSIHADDFSAEWRLNVLRGYASRSIPVTNTGLQRLRIYLLDPGIVIQEVLIHSK